MSFIRTKNYHWRQTKDKILIYTYLSQRKNSNFYMTHNYLKATSKTACLSIELFLWGEINTKKSFIVLNKNEIIFSLEKNNIDIEWPTLEKNNLNKMLISQFRTQQYENLQHISELTAKNKLDIYENRKKEAVRAQILLDSLVNNKININQMVLTKQAISMLENRHDRSNLFYSEHVYKKKEDEILRKDNINNDKASLKLPFQSDLHVIKKIFKQQDCIQTDAVNYQKSVEYNFDECKLHFPMRQSFVIPILFTEYILHTAARENHQV